MGSQGWCSVFADENKILIITIQAANINILRMGKISGAGDDDN